MSGKPMPIFRHCWLKTLSGLTWPPYGDAPMTITLTSENAAAVAEYSKLIGRTPEQLANHLLANPLDLFADPRSGSLEGFLGSIDYPDRETAHRVLARVAQIVTIQFDGKLPESFQGQVQELEPMPATLASRPKS